MKKETIKGIRMPTDLAKAIQAAGEKEHRTFSAQVRSILSDWLKENDITRSARI
jgi:hypothetical protein